MQAVVLELKDVAELDDKLPGELKPDNPVKWAAYQAMQHAGGRGVRIIVDNGVVPFEGEYQTHDYR